MNDLRLTQTNFEDEHFGRIDLYHSTKSPEEIFAKKTMTFKNSSDFKSAEKRMQQRMNIHHENLIRIIYFQSNERELSLTIVFEYFRSNFNEVKDHFRTPDNLYLFIKQMIDSLSVLEIQEMYHADVRPDYIYFDFNRQVFKLSDNFKTEINFYELQTENYQNGKHLLVSPYFFQQLVDGEAPSVINVFKQDIYSLGLLCLTIFESSEKIQLMYSENNGKHAQDHLQKLIDKIKKDNSGNYLILQLIEYTETYLLNESPSKRLSPRKAQKYLLTSMPNFLISDSNYLQENFGVDEIDIGYVAQLPDENVQIIKEMDKDEGLNANMEYEGLIPDMKALPKGEIDFAKRSKIFRQRKKEISSKPVPRWEIRFVNADMTYKNLNMKSVVNNQDQKTGNLTDPMTYNTGNIKVFGRVPNESMMNPGSFNVDGSKIQPGQGYLTPQIKYPAPQNRSLTPDNSGPYLQQSYYLQPETQNQNAQKGVYGLLSGVNQYQRPDLIYQNNELKRDISPIRTENTQTSSSNIPGIRKDLGVQALKKPDTNSSAKTPDSSQVVENAYTKVDNHNLNHHGKGIDPDPRKIQYNHVSNGMPVYRYN